MEQLLNAIKDASLGAVAASKPVQIAYGNVINNSPLEVFVDQRLTLTADFLIVPESLTHFEINLKHLHAYQDASDSGETTRNTSEALLEPIVIRRGLQIGDVVLLLRVQGGQDYIILDRLVST